jgi:uncharacterized membrane protein YoaT (DUF817 family)
MFCINLISIQIILFFNKKSSFEIKILLWVLIIPQYCRNIFIFKNKKRRNDVGLTLACLFLRFKSVFEKN